MTAGYPAEYGRKLGGVIEVVTTAAAGRGFGVPPPHRSGASIPGVRTPLVGIWRRERHAQRDGVGRRHRSVSRSAGRRELHESRVDCECFDAVRAGPDCVESIRRHPAARRGPVPRAERARAAGRRATARPQQHRECGPFSAQSNFSTNMVGDVVRWYAGVGRPLVQCCGHADRGSTGRGFREFYVKGAMSAHSGVHELRVGADVSVGTIPREVCLSDHRSRQVRGWHAIAFSFADHRANRKRRSSSRIKYDRLVDAERRTSLGSLRAVVLPTARSVHGLPRPGRGQRLIWCCAHRTIAHSRLRRSRTC